VVAVIRIFPSAPSVIVKAFCSAVMAVVVPLVLVECTALCEAVMVNSKWDDEPGSTRSRREYLLACAIVDAIEMSDSACELHVLAGCGALHQASRQGSSATQSLRTNHTCVWA
jgi:hypothetical protein